MCIITSVLCLSNGFVNDIRNLNNSRTHGNPYGIKGPEPTKIISIQFNKMKKKKKKKKKKYHTIRAVTKSNRRKS
jgi:hypothetical protein